MFGAFFLSVIVAFVALGFGWLVSFNNAENPTFGDVWETTKRTSGIPALVLIVVFFIIAI